MLAAIYWLVIRGYAVAIRIAALFNAKAKLFVAGRKDIISRLKYALINERRPRIWMHCASLGEFEQGRPVLEKLRAKYPDHAIVLTFFSSSGYEVRKDYPGADYIFYLPVDSPHAAKCFLDIVQPQLCFFVKYEFWYFYLTAIAKRDIPVLLISAIFNKNQPFFQWYGVLHRRMLACFAHIFVQDAESERLLNKIDIQEVSLSGDTRFDRVVEATEGGTVSLLLADQFCDNPNIIVAGSTWEEDEVFLKKVSEQIPPDFKMILVPHEVHDSHINAIEQLFTGQTIRWSSGSIDKSKRVLIVDQVGLLLKLYRYAKIAWVGGGFGKAGVHNVLEAAVYGRPVAFGPIYYQFLEAKELLAVDAAIATDDAATFASKIKAWNSDPKAYQAASAAASAYVHSKTGATDKIINYTDAKYWLRTK